MKFSNNLFIDEDLEDIENILELLNRGVPVYKVFLICVDKNGNNLIELISSAEIFKEIYSKKDYTLIGVAKDKKAAFELVRTMIEGYIQTESDFSKFKTKISR